MVLLKPKKGLRFMAPPKGFTLVEIMVVVAALVVVSVSAARYYSRGRRGEQAAAFSRIVLTLFDQARQESLLPGTTSRLRMVAPAPPETAFSLILEKREAGTAGTPWRPVSRLVAPKDLVFCTPRIAGVPTSLGTVACPMAGEEQLIFANGQLRYIDASGTPCPTGTAILCPGLSFPFKTNDDGKKWFVHL